MTELAKQLASTDIDRNDDGHFLSLGKMLKSPIKDIIVTISYEWDEPVVSLFALVLEDGTQIGVEGEHDIAYLATWHDAAYRFSLRDIRSRIDD